MEDSNNYMKTLNSSVLVWGVGFLLTVSVTEAVLTDTNLNVGTSHNLHLLNVYGYPTYNSIAAGQGNTNHAYVSSAIGAGTYNLLAPYRTYNTTTNAANPSPTVNDYTYNSAIGGGSYNGILGGGSVIAGTISDG